MPASPTNYPPRLKAMVEAGPPEWGSRRRRRPLHLAGRGPARTARHVADPQRKGSRFQLGRGQGHFPLRPAPPWSPGTPGLSPLGPRPKSWRSFWDVQDLPRPARPLQAIPTTTTRRRCSRPAQRCADIYPVTDDKVETRHGKDPRVEAERQNLVGSCGAQPPQLLSSGELAMYFALVPDACSR